MTQAPEPSADLSRDQNQGALVWFAIAGLVYLLLIGVNIIGSGFSWISGGAEGAEKIFAFASNPIVGVILGTLATALVQSSSTVTSVIVALVAGGVPVSIAIPMIMGANMGTTITNTIVSLGSMRDGKTFNRAFQAATVHDFFNLYSILIFLPIEILFKPLERISAVMAEWFVGGGSASIKGFNVVGAITKPVSNQIVDVFRLLPDTLGAVLTIVVGISLIIASVIYLGKLLRSVMTGKARGFVDKAIGRGPLTGVASGTLVTVLVQSSSTSTSLVVPLAGSGALTTRQVMPFTMGANIGTCVTALLAATAITGEFEVFALQIALVHLLYNVFGVILFLYTPWLGKTPIHSAEWLGNKTESNRGWAFAYIFSVFFLVPGGVFTGQTILGESAEVSEVLSGETLQDIENEVLLEGMNVE